MAKKDTPIRNLRDILEGGGENFIVNWRMLGSLREKDDETFQRLLRELLRFLKGQRLVLDTTIGSYALYNNRGIPCGPTNPETKTPYHFKKITDTRGYAYATELDPRGMSIHKVVTIIL